MTRRVNKLADRVLSVFLTDVPAGACVPEMGQLYWRSCGSCSCSGGRHRRKECECRINCTGTCVSTGRTRCITTQLACQ